MLIFRIRCDPISCIPTPAPFNQVQGWWLYFPCFCTFSWTSRSDLCISPAGRGKPRCGASRTPPNCFVVVASVIVLATRHLIWSWPGVPVPDRVIAISRSPLINRGRSNFAGLPTGFHARQGMRGPQAGRSDGYGASG